MIEGTGTKSDPSGNSAYISKYFPDFTAIYQLNFIRTFVVGASQEVRFSK